MTKYLTLSNIAKLTFLALVLVFIAYITYYKRNADNPKITFQQTVTAPLPTAGILQDSIVDYGMKFLGTPYVSAGCSADGFDCSGFVYYVFKHFKVQVPRSSAEFEHFGKEIPIEDVRKGDILLFLSPTRPAIGHIGIVSNPKGKASDFIHASSGREMKVIITSLATKGYTRRFVKAVRVL